MPSPTFAWRAARVADVRLYVVGTDTGVGKTRVTAALAFAHTRALAHDVAKPPPTIVKLVQTGLAPGVSGDAEYAANIADSARHYANGVADASQTPWRELARFLEPADPWNAALAAGVEPLTIGPLAAALDALAGDLIVEGSGGAAVPLDATHSISEVAREANCEAVIVVGLRLGCINHALLTLQYLARLGMPVRGAITTEAFGPVTHAYRDQVERALVAKDLSTALIAWDSDAARSVAGSAAHLTPFLENR